MKNKNIMELASCYREAWLTSQRLESGIYLRHASVWPEMHGAEQASSKVRPTPEDVERLVECINWLTVLNDDERKLIWLRASGLDWRSIATRSGIPRSTIYRHWHKTLLSLSLKVAREKERMG